MSILVATHDAILRVDAQGRDARPAGDFAGRFPTCIAWDPWAKDRAWCGTHRDGVFVSDNGGRTWRAAGLHGERVMTIVPSLAERDTLWVGTEPSAVWHSADAGNTWERLHGLDDLPSSSDWSFPPRPDTHHVRWIACHPERAGQLWIAIEAGALVSTPDAGRTWYDRVSGGPYDTHELAIHPERPDALRVAAGDGYYESDDGGSTWTSPGDGLEVSYLRSVAIDPADPDVLIVSASSHAHSAYVAGRSDGRIYRRRGGEPWQRITDGWPDPPSTIAPLLAAGNDHGEFFAADERGVHRSSDGGVTWNLHAAFPETPHHLRGLAVPRVRSVADRSVRT